MSDEETKTDDQGNVIDPERFKNFQSEIDRKLGNTHSQIEQLTASNQQVLELLNNLNQPKSQQKDDASESLGSLLYEDPDKYAELLRKQVKQELSQEFQKKEQQSNKSAQVLQELSNHYPELRDTNSDLSKKAVQIFDSFSAEDKANVAVAYRAAINEAASDLGIQRASKRRKEGADFDDFTLSSSSSSGSRRESKPKLDDRTILFAEAMGMNTDDKALLKRLAERSKKNYKKGGPVSR